MWLNELHRDLQNNRPFTPNRTHGASTASMSPLKGVKPKIQMLLYDVDQFFPTRDDTSHDPCYVLCLLDHDLTTPAEVVRSPPRHSWWLVQCHLNSSPVSTNTPPWGRHDRVARANWIVGRLRCKNMQHMQQEVIDRESGPMRTARIPNRQRVYSALPTVHRWLYLFAMMKKMCKMKNSLMRTDQWNQILVKSAPPGRV